MSENDPKFSILTIPSGAEVGDWLFTNVEPSDEGWERAGSGWARKVTKEYLERLAGSAADNTASEVTAR